MVILLTSHHLILIYGNIFLAKLFSKFIHKFDFLWTTFFCQYLQGISDKNTNLLQEVQTKNNISIRKVSILVKITSSSGDISPLRTISIEFGLLLPSPPPLLEQDLGSRRRRRRFSPQQRRSGQSVSQSRFQYIENSNGGCCSTELYADKMGMSANSGCVFVTD